MHCLVIPQHTLYATLPTFVAVVLTAFSQFSFGSLYWFSFWFCCNTLECRTNVSQRNWTHTDLSYCRYHKVHTICVYYIARPYPPEHVLLSCCVRSGQRACCETFVCKLIEAIRNDLSRFWPAEFRLKNFYYALVFVESLTSVTFRKLLFILLQC